MSGDNPENDQMAGVRSDPVLSELDSLRAEVLRLRRQERRHLAELAKFAKIAESRRFGWSRIRSAGATLRSRWVSMFRKARKKLILRLPERVKAILRRMRARYLS